MNTDEMKADARRLYIACARVLDGIKIDDFPNACVSWPDLRCMRACVGFDESGDVVREVVLDGASPDGNRAMERAISKALGDELDGVYVEVRCEW